MPELYDHVLSDGCYTVRLMLGLCRIAYVKRTVPFIPGVTVPTFADGERAITGTIPILRHIAALDPQRWCADEPDVARWLAFAEGPLAALSHARSRRLFDAGGDLDLLVVDSRLALRAIDDQLTDQHLASSDWLAAPTHTIADVAVFAPVMLSHDAGIGHEDYPAINLWQRRMRKLDGFVNMPGIPDYF